MQEKTALVIEGGAMRGIYAAGILDAFLEKSFNPFDIVIGVSAGASNGAVYLAGMRGRNYSVYTDYSTRGEFISWWKFLTGGHLIDLDWLWDISIKEIPIDAVAMKASGVPILMGITSAENGRIFYREPDEENLADVLKASSAVPFLYRNILELDNIYCTDGGIADPIPVRKALEEGADRIMVIRSRQRSFTMKSSRPGFIVKRALRKWPGILRAIEQRADRYNSSIELIRNPPEGVIISEVCPPEDFSISRLTTDISLLDREYHRAVVQGFEVIKQWETVSAG